MTSFIVEFWEKVFFLLDKISLFSIIRFFYPRAKTYNFVDAYVLAHLVLSVFGVVIVVSYPNSNPALVFIVYGIIRVFEISVYQTNILLFDEYRAVKAGRKYAVRGYRRLVLLLLHNYVEIIFWFAASYIYFAESFVHKWGKGTFAGGIYSSFIAMSTFGDFNLTPKDAIGAAILAFQSASGLFMTLLSLARFIGLLPKPKTKDELERNVVTRRRRARIR